MIKKKTTNVLLAAILFVAMVVVGCNSSSHPLPEQANENIAGIQIDTSGRYFQKNGKPFFFIGYYDWAPVVKGETWESGVSMKGLIDLAAEYDLNYIRISPGLTNYGVEYGSIPFKRIDGQVDQVDLGQWDTAYWSADSGLPWQAQYAASKGVNMHIAIFFGNGFEHQQHWSWPNNYWNVKNQVRDFYGDLDTDRDGGIDEMNEFYRTADFVNNTGVGFYQKKLIDKIVAEMAPYQNVFFEVGNELMGGSELWNYEVIKYLRSKTDKVVTINLNPSQATYNDPGNDQGYSIHVVEPNGRWEGGNDSSLEVKKWVESNVGEYVPVFYDPDGPNLGQGFADENRRAAWYSLTGGAAGYGGFQTDVRNGKPDTVKLRYYQHLMNFLSETKVPFWTMTPQLNLISNNLENNLLAKEGEQYLAYIRNDDSVEINLAAGSYKYKTYNPKTGVFSAEQTIINWGGGNKSFIRPSGENWVIYIYLVTT